MSALALTWHHTRFQLLETVRVPIAVVGTMVFPALALVFFVLPQRAVAQDPASATAAVAQLALFAAMSTFTFTYGAGVAEDRALPFDAYVRTLPAGPGARLGGRVLSGLVLGLASLVPLVLIGWLFTAADPTPGRLALGAVAVLVSATPFLLLGLAIGYGLSTKAALAVAQVVLFPLAFAGGLFLPPQMFPAWLDTLSRLLPSRAGRDVVHWVLGGPWSGQPVVVLVAWTLVLGVLAVAADRRDEGRRFR